MPRERYRLNCRLIVKGGELYQKCADHGDGCAHDNVLKSRGEDVSEYVRGERTEIQCKKQS